MDIYGDEPLDDDFDEEEMDMDENDLLDDDTDKEAEEEEDYREYQVPKSRMGYCRFCGAEVIVDELPDSISRDAFDDFGICLNCQWGIFMDNGGHF